MITAIFDVLAAKERILLNSVWISYDGLVHVQILRPDHARKILHIHADATGVLLIHDIFTGRVLAGEFFLFGTLRLIESVIPQPVSFSATGCSIFPGFH